MLTELYKPASGNVSRKVSKSNRGAVQLTMPLYAPLPLYAPIKKSLGYTKVDIFEIGVFFENRYCGRSRGKCDGLQKLQPSLWS